MSKKSLGVVVGVLGLLISEASLMADIIGLGRHEGFGFRQLSGVLLGIGVLMFGVWMWNRGSD